MEPRQIFARALPAPITVELDVMEELFRRPTLLRFIEHPGEGERDFIERPAIHSGKIDRRRLDPIIDLKGERFVASANEGLPDGGCPFPDWKRLPIFLTRFCHQTVEAVAAFEDRFKRETRLSPGGSD